MDPRCEESIAPGRSGDEWSGPCVVCVGDVSVCQSGVTGCAGERQIKKRVEEPACSRTCNGLLEIACEAEGKTSDVCEWDPIAGREDEAVLSAAWGSGARQNQGGLVD